MSKNFEETTEYLRRAPIKLSPHAVALIQIFTRTDKWEDIWTHDVDSRMQSEYENYDLAAKQFVSQLECQWCIAFMQSLRNEIDAHIQEHENTVARINHRKTP